MIHLAWELTRSAPARFVLVAATTAMVSELLLVAVALVNLWSTPDGLLFATGLLCVPPLLLLNQALRLGTATRERRLAALRIVGATPREIRRLGAYEVGIPALAGSVLGIAVYGFLRLVIGGSREPVPSGGIALWLVPAPPPAWWQVLAVVAGVTALGVLLGLYASRGVVVTPLGIARRQHRQPPRPWVLALVLLGLALIFDGSPHRNRALGSEWAAYAIIALLVLGIVGLAPWAAYAVGRFVAARATSAPSLLAAKRLVADPRPAGWAGAAVGGIGLVAGGGSVAFALAPYAFTGYARAGAAAVAALVVVTVTMSVHSVESLMDRKRSMASLAAFGSSADVLKRAQRWEIGLAAMPLAAGGLLVGLVLAGALAILDGAALNGAAPSLQDAVVALTGVAATLGLVWAAVLIATRVTRRWQLTAADASNLRTE